MDLDDILPPKRRGETLAELGREDLDRLSVDELRERIAALDAEAARTRAKLEASGGVRSAADALFKR